MLVYGSNAVLPVEVAIYTHQITSFQEDFNYKALRKAHDLLLMVRGCVYPKRKNCESQDGPVYNHILMSCALSSTLAGKQREEAKEGDQARFPKEYMH